jgi:hypothetical protein
VVAVLLVELKEKEFFLSAPRFLADCWIEVVVPSLAALFARALNCEIALL